VGPIDSSDDSPCNTCDNNALFNITTVSAVVSCVDSRAADYGAGGRFTIDSDSGQFAVGDLRNTLGSRTYLEVDPNGNTGAAGRIDLHGRRILLGRKAQSESYLQMISPSSGSSGVFEQYTLGSTGNTIINASPASGGGSNISLEASSAAFPTSAVLSIDNSNAGATMPIGSITSTVPMRAPYIWQVGFYVNESADRTSTSTTLANLGLVTTVPLRAGATYSIQATLLVDDSVVGDGLKFDFNNSTATILDFRAFIVCVDLGGFVFRQEVTDFTTTFGFSAVTLAGQVQINATFTPATDGTIGLRFAQNSHSTGTLTVHRGSFMLISETSPQSP